MKKIIFFTFFFFGIFQEPNIIFIFSWYYNYLLDYVWFWKIWEKNRLKFQIIDVAQQNTHTTVYFYFLSSNPNKPNTNKCKTQHQQMQNPTLHIQIHISIRESIMFILKVFFFFFFFFELLKL